VQKLGILLPTQWHTASWTRQKAKRQKWFKMAKKWKPRQIVEHNAAIASPADNITKGSSARLSSPSTTTQVPLPLMINRPFV
jgi:hypothetical protein